ncbi:MAG: RNA methyltransferase, partial [Actinomycetia bacterium]|nr:RNA methyltransferase [Actinomycetes bacterium]
RLRGRGVRVLAAEARGERLDEWARAGRLAAPAAWVVGNEAWGLPEAERALCDAALSVPMWGRAESLNVAAALAVCLYATALAQHEAPGQDPGCRAGVP